MEQVNEQLNKIGEASIASLRSQVNQLLNSLGLYTASGSASLLSGLIIAVLVCNILFALNIGLGLWLGSCLGSWPLGFLALMGIYILLLLGYLLYRSRVERRVQDKVARQVHHLTDNINLKLNETPELQVAPEYHEAYISSEPFPYEALRLRRDEAIRQRLHAQQDLKQGVQYLRSNYQAIFGKVLNHSVPAYRYVAPILDLFSSKEEQTSRRSSKPSTLERLSKSSTFIGKTIQAVAPYTPYFSIAYAFIRPVATSYLLSKTQSWLLRKLLGSNTPKRKR